MAVVGANGSGKSTLARLLGGLARPAGAEVAEVCGHDLCSDDGHYAVRRDVGVLFQNPDNQLVGATVEEDLAFGLENLALPSPEIAARVSTRCSCAFGLDALRTREPHLLVRRPAAAHGAGRRTGGAATRARARRADRNARPGRPRRRAGRRARRGRARPDGRPGDQEMDEVLLGRQGRGAERRPDGLRRPAGSLLRRARAVDALSLGLPPAAPRSAWR